MLKQISFVICLSLFFLFLLLPAPLNPENDVAVALYNEGLKKYVLGDYDGAIKDFDGALTLKPEDSKIKKMYINTLIKKGNIEYEGGNLKKAEKYFLKAYTLSGEDEKLRENLKMIQEQIEAQTQEIALSVVESEEVTPQEEAVEPIKEVSRPERVEVILPFNIDEFIQQQSEENKRILNEIVETQRQERESLFKNISENQKLLDESLHSQQLEREKLYSNLEDSRSLLDESIKSQQVERESLYKNIVESRRVLDESMSAQKDERIALIESIQYNQKLVEQNIEMQREEREGFLNNMMEMARSQSEDRKLYSRSLMTTIGGAIIITIILITGFFAYLKKRIVSPLQKVYYEPQSSVEHKSKTLLEYTDKIDETEQITSDSYSEVVRAKRLRELYSEFQKGNLSWDVLQGYITELNYEVKSEILNMIEKKISSGNKGGLNEAFEVLLPLITDGEEDIGSRSRNLIKSASGGLIEAAPEFVPAGELSGTRDLLNIFSLLPMAHIVDTKTGRVNHSVRVADISFMIARQLNDPQLAPSVVKKVALVHDIGYLEIDESLPKKQGKLTDRQYAIIKSHTERGIRLFQHIALPQVFYEGIKFHHERLDGSGYPEGLSGEDVPIIARVIAAADFFEAVTSKRPYRPAHTVNECLQMLEKRTGNVFDPRIVNILIEIQNQRRDDAV